MPIDLTLEEIEDLIYWLGVAYCKLEDLPVEQAKIRRMKSKLNGAHREIVLGSTQFAD